MFSLDQKLSPVQLPKDTFRRLSPGYGKIAENIDFIFPCDMVIPLPYHMGVHLFIVGESAHIHTVILAVVEEMQIRDI